MTTQKFIWHKMRKALVFASLAAVSLLSPLSAIAQDVESIDFFKPGIKVDKVASPTSLPPGGGSVTYTYTVTNTGNVSLSNVVVTDDKCSPVTYVSGDTDADGKLDKTETWKFKCTKVITKTTTNIGKVTASVAQGKTVSDTDTATVIVLLIPPPPPPEEKLGIHVEKEAKPMSLPAGGGSVTYTYWVTNTGNASLSNISVVDNKCSPVTYVSGDTDADGKLDVSEKWKFECKDNIKETTTNTVVAEGTRGKKTVSDDDKVTVTVGVIPPPPPPEDLDIHVEKDAEPELLPAGGGMVTYTYLVTNPGKHALSEIVVQDNKCSPLNFIGGDTDGDKKLDVGETWKYECKQEIKETTTNVVVASGGKGGKRVYDSAKEKVVVSEIPPPPPPPELGIHLEKDASPDSLGVGGGNVTYTYWVTNTGTQSLSNVKVVDDKCSPVTYVSGDTDSDNRLDVNEKWKFECTKNITETTTNTAEASGSRDGKTVKDDDTALVRVAIVPPPPPSESAVNIVKNANVGFLPAGGGPVTYTYWVNSIGSVPLSNVSVIDDRCSPVTYVSGDADGDNMLDANELWRYTCTVSIIATTTNVATVNATSNNIAVSDTASVTVFVGTIPPPPPPPSSPAIHVNKTAPTQIAQGGGSVTYTYTVTNIGNVPLSNISLSDNKCSPIEFLSGDSNLNNMLDTGEAWGYKCTQFISQTTTNTVTATGFGNNTTVSSTDSATVIVPGVPPPPPPPPGADIRIEKMASPSSLPAGGGSVTYFYAVTNPGNVALSNIVVSDNKCSPVTYMSGDADGDNLLDISETWNFRCNTNVVSSVTNIGKAQGTANGAVIHDTDTATVIVGDEIPPPPPPPEGLPGTGLGGANDQNTMGMTVAALIAMAAFLGIVGVSLFSQEQEKKLKR